jgi:nitrite reductase/ring-hydroxylating ferredoxin subunit
MGEKAAVNQWVLACAVDDLDDGDSMRFENNDEPVAIYRIGNEFYATADTCTHEKWSLGEEGDLDGFEITCTLHNARFDIRDGKALCFPAIVNLARYSTMVEGGKVFIAPAGDRE